MTWQVVDCRWNVAPAVKRLRRCPWSFSIPKATKRSDDPRVQPLRFARWEVTCDPMATKAAYGSVSLGGPEICGCDPCMNFAAARRQIYPSDVLDLLDQLGISADREVEVYHLGRVAPGRHLYGGWFHFVGTVLSGADAWKQVRENVWQPDLQPVIENFSLGFSSRLGLVRKPFAGLSLVQLEFSATVPWVLQSPEPA